MYNRISVLVPTRRRLDRLDAMIRSYDQTTVGCASRSELVFRVDEDDLDTQDYLALRSSWRVHVGPRLNGYGSMPTFFNELYETSIGDVLMSANDDFVFRTPHWAEILLNKANEFPDGLFNLGVDTLNADHYPFGIVSRRAADALGFYWDPRVFWGDIYLRDVMAALNRCVMVPEVRIDHDWVGFRPDRTFAETRPYKERIESSSTYWSNIHAPAVNEAVETLRRLQCVNATS